MNINSSSNNNNNIEMDIEHDGQMYIISNFSSNSEGNNHNVTTIEINGNILNNKSTVFHNTGYRYIIVVIQVPYN